MEKAFKKLLTKEVSSLYIEGFDPYDDSNIAFLKKIICSIFKFDEEIFFLGHREDSLLPYEEAEFLRSFIPDYFQKHGRFLIIERKDEDRFNCIASLKLNYTNIEFIIKVWKYFYGLELFIPKSPYDWEKVAVLGKNLFSRDIDGLRILSSGITDFLVIKNLGGDSLIFNYRNEFINPFELLKEVPVKIEVIESPVENGMKKDVISKNGILARLYNFLDRFL